MSRETVQASDFNPGITRVHVLAFAAQSPAAVEEAVLHSTRNSKSNTVATSFVVTAVLALSQIQDFVDLTYYRATAAAMARAHGTAEKSVRLRRCWCGRWRGCLWSLGIARVSGIAPAQRGAAVEETILHPTLKSNGNAIATNFAVTSVFACCQINDSVDLTYYCVTVAAMTITNRTTQHTVRVLRRFECR